MTLLRSLTSLSIFPRSAAWLCLLCLTACAGAETKPPDPEKDAAAQRARKDKTVSSQFEWAVQNYEAGEYDRAIPQLQRLKSLGSELKRYELLPFYLGMSFYHRENYPAAAAELESFLRGKTNETQGQDARIALLSVYERTGAWDKLLGLAAETDRLALFQGKRAFLKLVWARALKEKGELQGARAVLKSTVAYLDDYDSRRAGGGGLDQDLWGRYHYTLFLLEEESCRTNPKEIGKKKRLYQAWLDSSVDCYGRQISQLTKELGDSNWLPLAVAHLERSLGVFGEKIAGYQKAERAHLEKYRELQGLARKNLYRLMSHLESAIKSLKNQGLNHSGLEPLRKQIDHLLVSLAQQN